MITDIYVSDRINGFFKLEWRYNGKPNSIKCGSGDEKISYVNKLLDAQIVQTKNNKIVPKIRYVKERRCRRN